MEYSPEDIPQWCHMPMDEHRCAGGCWGIWHGEVARKGREHCEECDYNQQTAKGIAMSDHEFKRQVALALLRNLDWMPDFNGLDDAAEYLHIEAPESTGDIIALGQQAIAVMVAETAERIVKQVG